MIRYKLLLIVLLIVGCDEDIAEVEKTAGCMNSDNSNYNPLATIHVADSCAVIIYGCTDSTAINYDPSVTDLCSGVSIDQCCTYGVFGCTNPNYENYNENANVDDGSCSGAIAITYGCILETACNYNHNATHDCSKVADGNNINCCIAASETETECVMDMDNDGFQDIGTTSQTLPPGNCGCSTIGFGWKNSEDTNGEAIYGCLNPLCPEYNPAANIDDGSCCL